MVLATLLVAALLQAVQPAAARAVPDPGVISTGQRITPAGMQTIFAGKIGGVRFGEASDEVWVAVPGSVERLAWRENRVIDRVPVDGRPGVDALALDRVGHRIISTSVGWFPLMGMLGRQRPAIIAQVRSFDTGIRRPGTPPVIGPIELGDNMAGAPAVGSLAGANRRRLVVVPLPANDSLAVLDADDGTLITKIELGVEPIAAVISANSRVAYVSVLGGAKPTPRQRAARQCCDARAEAVRVDARGVAEPGSVSRVDLVSGRVTDDITVGRHPTALVWDERGNRLYVAAGNADSISVIDTQKNRVMMQIAITPFRERLPGLAPTALALAPDMRKLYVGLGGVNAVAVYDVGRADHPARLLGLIPTGWYPSSLDVSRDGQYLAVGTLYGVGAGVGTVGGQRGRYALANRGAVNLIRAPSAAELAAYSVAVAQNNRLTLSSATVPEDVRHNGIVAPMAVPSRPGDPSLIQHVVFIVKENRTFDQVLGDLDRGARDPSLVMYGRDVTPNVHALSQQFVTLDHFFVSGGNSADGHQWLTQANETEYTVWPLYYGRSYPSESDDALAYAAGGFLWETARAKGRSVAVFGEYAPPPKTASPSVRRQLLAEYRARPNDMRYQRGLLQRRFNTRSEIPSLDRELVREYPGWTQESPDVIKAGDILSHLAEWESAGAMPNLTMISLPSDHTIGMAAGWCSPKACVADNDLALGKVVEGLSHSRFWKDMAILVVEDDAQDGVDHIDGHRTVALAVSPFSRRGSVDSVSYSQPSMVKTIELMLGLPAMSIFDLVATDMRASFIGPTEKPDFTPYTALQPQQSIYDVNLNVGSIKGPFATARRRAAQSSARMDFLHPDAAPTERLNRILWGDAKGWNVKYPAVRHVLFFPLALDIADDDREGAERPARPAAPKKHR